MVWSLGNDPFVDWLTYHKDVSLQSIVQRSFCCRHGVLSSALLTRYGGMKPFAVALAGLMLAGGLALVVSTVSTGAFAPVYTVSELRVGLADHPHVWLGQTMLVRGVALGLACPPNASCVVAWPALGDADATRPDSTLPLSMGPPNSLLALLRRLPLVGRLVPAPQLLRWGRPAVYRIQVRDTAGTSPKGTRHYEAVLLDPAAPGHGPMPIWQGPALMPPQPVPRSTLPPQ
jgi:hypothetical protein